jgi:catechol 2,3-dioxygenase-like lactoylglutathione lyase family enzyme
MQATQPSGLILYVSDLDASVAFYRQLLAAEPLERMPQFALFPFAGPTTLGLWVRDDVEPAANAPAGSIELCAALPSDDAVRAAHDEWLARGWPSLQAPVLKEFGYTACTADPDGHRVRVYRMPG